MVGGEKGGSGKSCIAQNLAVYLQNNNRDVLLLDADPQGTTTDWVKEREQNQISKILLKAQVTRANRSMIVKAAIQQLASLSPEQLNQAVTSIKNES